MRKKKLLLLQQNLWKETLSLAYFSHKTKGHLIISIKCLEVNRPLVAKKKINTKIVKIFTQGVSNNCFILLLIPYRPLKALHCKTYIIFKVLTELPKQEHIKINVFFIDCWLIALLNMYLLTKGNLLMVISFLQRRCHPVTWCIKKLLTSSVRM